MSPLEERRFCFFFSCFSLRLLLSSLRKKCLTLSGSRGTEWCPPALQKWYDLLVFHKSGRCFDLELLLRDGHDCGTDASDISIPPNLVDLEAPSQSTSLFLLFFISLLPPTASNQPVGVPIISIRSLFFSQGQLGSEKIGVQSLSRKSSLRATWGSLKALVVLDISDPG